MSDRAARSENELSQLPSVTPERGPTGDASAQQAHVWPPDGSLQVKEDPRAVSSSSGGGMKFKDDTVEFSEKAELEKEPSVPSTPQTPLTRGREPLWSGLALDVTPIPKNVVPKICYSDTEDSEETDTGAEKRRALDQSELEQDTQGFLLDDDDEDENDEDIEVIDISSYKKEHIIALRDIGNDLPTELEECRASLRSRLAALPALMCPLGHPARNEGFTKRTMQLLCKTCKKKTSLYKTRDHMVSAWETVNGALEHAGQKHSLTGSPSSQAPARTRRPQMQPFPLGASRTGSPDANEHLKTPTKVIPVTKLSRPFFVYKMAKVSTPSTPPQPVRLADRLLTAEKVETFEDCLTDGKDRNSELPEDDYHALYKSTDWTTFVQETPMAVKPAMTDGDDTVVPETPLSVKEDESKDVIMDDTKDLNSGTAAEGPRNIDVPALNLHAEEELKEAFPRSEIVEDQSLELRILRIEQNQMAIMMHLQETNVKLDRIIKNKNATSPRELDTIQKDVRANEQRIMELTKLLVNGFEQLAGNYTFALTEPHKLDEYKTIKAEAKPNKVETARPKPAPVTNTEPMSISPKPSAMMKVESNNRKTSSTKPKAELSVAELARNTMAIRPSTDWKEVVRGREDKNDNKQPLGPPGAPSSSPRIVTSRSISAASNVTSKPGSVASKTSFAQVAASKPSSNQLAAAPAPKVKGKPQAASKVYAPLPADQLERVLNGLSPKPTRHVIALYATGLKANRISMIKRVLSGNCGVNISDVPHIGFIGRSIAEFHVYQDRAVSFKEKVTAVIPSMVFVAIDPLDPSLYKDDSVMDKIRASAEKLTARLSKRFEVSPISGHKKLLSSLLRRAREQKETGTFVADSGMELVQKEDHTINAEQ